MARQLFEVSWEVCNKVGGIYTVLSSKARHAVAAFGEHYYTLGPLLEKNPGFREETFPGSDTLLSALRERGIEAKAGRWDIAGEPQCILVKFHNVVPDQNRLLYSLWEDYGVDSMFGQWDYIEPVLFSTVCALAIEAAIAGQKDDAEVYAHFHEWMCGAGLLYLKKNVPQVCTVFTTHATILGRAMSGSGVDLSYGLDEIDPVQEAKRHNITAKYSMESVSARQADCFTAVSELTAREALALLGVQPGVVTPNAFDTDDVPNYAKDHEAFRTRRLALVDFASRFLKKKLDPAKTRIFSISGRYEFQNKGIDILLESLKSLDDRLRAKPGDETTVVAFFLVVGGYAGVHEEALRRVQATFAGMESDSVIATHHLIDKHNDPVLNGCQRLGLTNRPENRCHVIFIPAYLDGNDGILNKPYYDVLAGCDLGVYPSSYEPWGYTPLESIVYSVPAITSDKAGFGVWVKDHYSGKNGVLVLERQGRNSVEAAQQLTDWLAEAAAWDEAAQSEWKKAARATAAGFNWKEFYKFYQEAYQKALMTRRDRASGMHKQQEEEVEATTFIAPTNSTQPRLRPFSVVSELPAQLKRLGDIAYSMWWVWNRDARELFKRLDPVLWDRVTSNPVALLQQIDEKRLADALASDSYMQIYNAVVARYNAQAKGQPCRVEGLKNLSPKSPVAYFSMEFGIHEALPIYSGGLGVLSGDHLKSASDLNLPLLGIGLLYKFGYFRQHVNRHGEQIPVYEENNFGQMPVRQMNKSTGQKLRIAVEMPGRIVFAQAWLAQVGNTPLYLLDTDVDENSQKDRFITSKLYDSSTRERIEQELLLGVGGVTLLRALGIEPAVYHLNEGHSAFLLLEQMKLLMKEKKLDFDTAREVVRSRSVFTTHTPVPAGNERHAKGLMENYFRSYVEQCGIAWEQFWNLGHLYAGEDSDFEMTVFALKMCSRYNGVSRLHGRVARSMWQHVWRGFLPDEAPIGSITNGVHFGSWISDDMRATLETYAGMDPEEAMLDEKQWRRVDDIPANVLWQTHNHLKNRLFEQVHQSVQAQWTREGEAPELLDSFQARINPAAFTIGFARRIATYKRPLLILKNLERLRRLVKDDSHPVQIIVAGKAHPADREAANLIREIVRVSKEPDFLGRIVFIEDYNIRLARAMVSGVDLWLNNPVRPLEASGTSGMKAAFNGVINCSILDGWWDECYAGGNGWAIGDRTTLENRESQDLLDSESLYELLEEKVVPMYYSRNARGVPEQWVSYMKSVMKSALPVFNTHRMVRDYAVEMYEPAAAGSAVLSRGDYAKARSLSDWKKKLPVRFATLSLREVRIEGLDGNILNVKNKLRVTANVEPGKMRPSEVLMEVIVQGASGDIVCKPMALKKNHGAYLVYEGEFVPPATGQFKYGIRAIPIHPDTANKYEACLVSWG